MNSEKWQKIKGILEEAIEAPPSSRPQYLEKACAGDQDLRREVEDLLDFENAEADLLEQTAFSAVMQNGSAKTARNLTGTQIGKYKITGEIGTGGMGAVYLAERIDGAFEQKAALKLIKRGMDSEAILSRFLNERRILASLKHPHIAHLIDGGTTDDGLPYFVMEYVEGLPITEYAERENLDLEEMLKLFRKICAAVSFAHSNLVIHRDLKPSNILVTKDGTPKLLDFGIAKLLKIETDDALTATQMHVFTPEYASPEQIRGEKLTTSTDVYSLGVILYQLLTGKRPYKTNSRNISEIIRAVCETEPIRPSSAGKSQWTALGNKTDQNNEQAITGNELQINPKSKFQNPKLLKGDLDNIILKALRKEPGRRYSSVEQLSEDIRRHLQGLPVKASKDTWSYRASKFVNRNRLGVAAAGLILLTLLSGLGATLYQMNVAGRERAKAERRFNDVRRLANSFMFEINEEIERSPVKARELLVERAVEYLDQLSQESAGNTELESELAAAFEKIGNVQAEIFKPTLGKTSEALASHQKSLQMREKLYAADPQNVSRALEVIKSRQRIGDIFSMCGRVTDARQSYLEAIRLGEQLLALEPNNFQVRRSLYQSYARLGQAVLRSGSLGEALLHYNKSMAIAVDLLKENPTDAGLKRALSIIHSYTGYAKMEMGAGGEAIQNFQKALEIMQNSASVDENNLQARGDVSTALLWYGVSLSNIGKTEEGIVQIRQSLEMQKSLFEADKANFSEQNALADCYLELGKALAQGNQINAALENYQSAIKNYEAVWQADNQNLSAKRQLSLTRRHLASALQQDGKTSQALELFQQTIKNFKELTISDPNNIEWRHDLAICYLKIGEILLKTDNQKQAPAHFEQALVLLEKLIAQSPENINIRGNLETVKNHIANSDL